MDSLTITTTSPDATREVAQCLASRVRAGDVIALQGELGAGKTVFVQGLAAGLHVAGRVTSPTFVIMRRHQTPSEIPADNPPVLYHVDAYRLGSGNELLYMGLDDWLEDGVVAVEWAQNVLDALPPDRLEIGLSSAGESRIMAMSAHGPRAVELLEQLRRCGY